MKHTQWLIKPVHTAWVGCIIQHDVDSYISPVITEWHTVQKYNYMVTQTEYSHPQSWGALGPERVKRGSNLSSINTKTCNWRIIDDDCAAIATRQRGGEKKNTNEEHEWPAIPRWIPGELHILHFKRKFMHAERTQYEKTWTDFFCRTIQIIFKPSNSRYWAQMF